MIDRKTYNQLSSTFDEWEHKRLTQPNNKPQLILDYDEVLSDLEQIFTNEENSRSVEQSNHLMILDDDEVLSGFEKLLPDEENLSDVKPNSNPPGANLYNWKLNSGEVKVRQAEKIYSETWENFNVAMQNTESQKGNLYFFDLKSNRVRVTSAEKCYPNFRRINRHLNEWKWLDSESIPATSTSQITAETALDSDQNKKNTVTRSSSRLFDQKPTRTHLRDNQNVKESGSDFSPSM